jgi:Co/Zn/Cd efflux system component
VSLTGAAWPDIVVGLAIAALLGASAIGIIRQALAVPQPALRRPREHTRTRWQTASVTGA